jgi:hypothetical protein
MRIQLMTLDWGPAQEERGPGLGHSLSYETSCSAGRPETKDKACALISRTKEATSQNSAGAGKERLISGLDTRVP